MVERVNTGVPGLDELISGGLPKGSTTLIAGDAGTGKTILASQFLWNGLENGETCLFISTDESPSGIIQNAAQFNWDFEGHDGFTIKYINPMKVNQHAEKDARGLIEDLGPDRVVVDSVSALLNLSENDPDIRGRLHNLLSFLHDQGITTMITGEEPGDHTRSNLAEFITDGVVKLDMSTLGEDVERTIQVSKMRSTDLDAGEYNFEFTGDGIEFV